MKMKYESCYITGFLLSILVDGALSWSTCKTCTGDYIYCEHGCCNYACCPNTVGIVVGTLCAGIILSVVIGGIVIYIVQNKYNREPPKNLNTAMAENNATKHHQPSESMNVERLPSEEVTQNEVAQEPPADMFR